MGKLITITQKLKNIMESGSDDLIDQTGFSCKLYYPPRMESCVNCVVDPIGRKSSNKYLHGGPIPFPFGGICPLCNGAGFHATETYDTITMKCFENPTQFIKIAGITHPDAKLLTKGYVTDLPKVLKSDYMIKGGTEYVEFRYSKIGPPIINHKLVQNRYFFMLWGTS
jgi:hypothetical protein